MLDLLSQGSSYLERLSLVAELSCGVVFGETCLMSEYEICLSVQFLPGL